MPDLEKLNGIDPLKLVERAVRNARPREAGTAERWVAVEDSFALGSTYSIDLCNAFGLDPYERIETRCEACERLMEEDHNNKDGHLLFHSSDCPVCKEEQEESGKESQRS